jgi:hypothetical protein
MREGCYGPRVVFNDEVVATPLGGVWGAVKADLDPSNDGPCYDGSHAEYRVRDRPAKRHQGVAKGSYRRTAAYAEKPIMKIICALPVV